MLTTTQAQALLELGYLTTGDALEYLDSMYLDVETSDSPLTLRQRLSRMGDVLTPIDERAIGIRDAILSLKDPRPLAHERRLDPRNGAAVHAGVYMAAMVAMEAAGFGWQDRAALRLVITGGTNPHGPGNTDWFTITPTVGNIAASTDKVRSLGVRWSRGPAPRVPAPDGVLAGAVVRSEFQQEELRKIDFIPARVINRFDGTREATIWYRSLRGISRLAIPSTAA